MYKTNIVKPLMSEKGFASSKTGLYLFDVPKNINKHAVARTVEAQFEVSVVSVNIANRKGKAKRTPYKGGRVSKNGRDVASKIAYVRLKTGQSLPFYQAEEEAIEKEEKAEAKIAEAQAKKESKTKPKASRFLGRKKSEEKK